MAAKNNRVHTTKKPGVVSKGGRQLTLPRELWEALPDGTHWFEVEATVDGYLYRYVGDDTVVPDNQPVVLPFIEARR